MGNNCCKPVHTSANIPQGEDELIIRDPSQTQSTNSQNANQDYLRVLQKNIEDAKKVQQENSPRFRKNCDYDNNSQNEFNQPELQQLLPTTSQQKFQSHTTLNTQSPTYSNFIEDQFSSRNNLQTAKQSQQNLQQQQFEYSNMIDSGKSNKKINKQMSIRAKYKTSGTHTLNNLAASPNPQFSGSTYSNQFKNFTSSRQITNNTIFSVNNSQFPNRMPSKQDSMLNCLFDSSIRYQRGDSIKPGKTYQALDLDTGGPLVIKSYGQDEARVMKIRKKLLKKILIMQQEYPDQIGPIKSILRNQQKGYDIVMEYMNGQSLQKMIIDFKRFEEEYLLKSIAKHLFISVYVLHKNNIVHGNIKSSNLIIDKTKVRIIDIPFYKISKQNLAFTKSQASAPEIFYGSPPTKASDIWSVGYILLEMYIGSTPWRNKQNKELSIRQIQSQYKRGKKFLLPRQINPEFKDLLTQIFDFNPAKRPTIKNLLVHPFIANMLESQQSSNMIYNSQRTPVSAGVDINPTWSSKMDKKQLTHLTNQQKSNDPSYQTRVNRTSSYDILVNQNNGNMTETVKEPSHPYPDLLYTQKSNESNYKQKVFDKMSSADMMDKKSSNAPNKSIFQQQSTVQYQKQYSIDTNTYRTKGHGGGFRKGITQTLAQPMDTQSINISMKVPSMNDPGITYSENFLDIGLNQNLVSFFNNQSVFNVNASMLQFLENNQSDSQDQKQRREIEKILEQDLGGLDFDSSESENDEDDSELNRIGTNTNSNTLSNLNIMGLKKTRSNSLNYTGRLGFENKMSINNVGNVTEKTNLHSSALQHLKAVQQEYLLAHQKTIEKQEKDEIIQNINQDENSNSQDFTQHSEHIQDEGSHHELKSEYSFERQASPQQVYSTRSNNNRSHRSQIITVQN